MFVIFGEEELHVVRGFVLEEIVSKSKIANRKTISRFVAIAVNLSRR